MDPIKNLVDSLKSHTSLNSFLNKIKSPDGNPKVGPDPKRWTQSDLNAMADDLIGFQFLDNLFVLCVVTDKTDKKTGKPTQQALNAQKALTALAPIGVEGQEPLKKGEKARQLTWQEYAAMIDKAEAPYVQDLSVRKQRLVDSGNALIDLAANELKKENITTLDKAKLLELAKSEDQSNVALYMLTYSLAGRAQLKNERGEYFPSALHTQEILNRYASDGKWGTLLKDINEVDKVVRKKIVADMKKNPTTTNAGDILVEPSTETKLTDGVSLSNLGRQTVTEAEAMAILAKKTQLKTNAEPKSPNFSEEALKAVMGIKKSVSLAT